jgi:hypothetical protein
MLVEDKFLFLSLPRCASTSFHIGCLRNNIEIKFVKIKQTKIPNLSLSNEELADNLIHGHEQLSQLTKKFGDDYDIITIKRNRHERFLSLWTHIVDELYRLDMKNIGDILSNMGLKDIIPNNHNVLESVDTIKKYVDTFFLENDIQTSNYYVYNMFEIGLTPTSYIHHHNKKIKWFDIDNLSELEEWVSLKLGKQFKLEKINSSKHIKTKFKIDDEFIEKYNQVYDPYDLHKIEHTLI